MDCPDIAHSLGVYTAAEVLEGDSAYQCDTCGTKRRALRSTVLRRLPSLLTLSCNRFRIDRSTNWQRVKVTSRCAFPLLLDMRPFGEHGQTEHSPTSTAAGAPHDVRSLTGGDGGCGCGKSTDIDSKEDPRFQAARSSMVWLADLLEGAQRAAADLADLTDLTDLVGDSGSTAEASASTLGLADLPTAAVEHAIRHLLPPAFASAMLDDDGAGSQQHPSKDRQEQELGQKSGEEPRQEGRLLYQLQAVIMHRGSAHSGHYFAYLRDGFREGNWEGDGQLLLPPAGNDVKNASGHATAGTRSSDGVLGGEKDREKGAASNSIGTRCDGESHQSAGPTLAARQQSSTSVPTAASVSATSSTTSADLAWAAVEAGTAGAAIGVATETAKKIAPRVQYLVLPSGSPRASAGARAGARAGVRAGGRGRGGGQGVGSAEASSMVSIAIDETSALAVIVEAILAKEAPLRAKNPTRNATKTFTWRLHVLAKAVGDRLKNSWSNVYKSQFGPLESFMKAQVDLLDFKDGEFSLKTQSVLFVPHEEFERLVCITARKDGTVRRGATATTSTSSATLAKGSETALEMLPLTEDEQLAMAIEASLQLDAAAHPAHAAPPRVIPTIAGNGRLSEPCSGAGPDLRADLGSTSTSTSNSNSATPGAPAPTGTSCWEAAGVKRRDKKRGSPYSSPFTSPDRAGGGKSATSPTAAGVAGGKLPVSFPVLAGDRGGRGGGDGEGSGSDTVPGGASSEHDMAEGMIDSARTPTAREVLVERLQQQLLSLICGNFFEFNDSQVRVAYLDIYFLSAMMYNFGIEKQPWQ